MVGVYMKRYRKRPLTVHAMLWDGTDECMVILKKFIPIKTLDDIWYGCAEHDGNKFELNIKTLEGVMTADVGDYVILGIKDELYPVKEQIFLESYEPIE